MSQCLINLSGGGVRKSLLDSITANANDILSGKVVINSDGELLTGTMTNRGAWNSSVSVNGSVTIPAGYHNGSGRVTNSTATMGGQTITPRSTSQTVSCSGRYMTGNIVVNGDSNLVAANIVSGKSIFGVAGNAKKYGWFEQFGANTTTRRSFEENGGDIITLYSIRKDNVGFVPLVAAGVSAVNIGTYGVSMIDGNWARISHSGARHVINVGKRDLTFSSSSVTLPLVGDRNGGNDGLLQIAGYY